MDGNSLTSTPKKQKLIEEHGVNVGSKSLDNLPDVVLQHILSCLSIKDAVRTSVLSKRWGFLWSSIPNLEFVERLDANRTLFMNFVERVLVHRGTSDIEKFSLTCFVLWDASRINAWITAAVRHNVQELCVNLSNGKEPFVLPHCLFTCATLRELDLAIPYILKLPSSICFSSLKILTLACVTFLDEYLTQQLFSGFPVLEELYLDDCNWVNIKVVSISAPKLWKLSIKDIDIDLHSSSNSDGCQVMIIGISLKDFNYFGEFTNDYYLYNSSSIKVACIHGYQGKRPREVAYRAYKLLMGLSNVKELTITPQVVEVLTNTAELLAHMPKFNNLTNLVFCAEEVDLNCEAVLKILQNSPSLHSLAFTERISLSSDTEKDDVIFDPVPPCFLSQLANIEVYNFEGNEEELHAVKILLKNATVLDRFSVFHYVDHTWNLEKPKKIREQILELPRGSESCEVVFN